MQLAPVVEREQLGPVEAIDTSSRPSSSGSTWPLQLGPVVDLEQLAPVEAIDTSSHP